MKARLRQSTPNFCYEVVEADRRKKNPQSLLFVQSDWDYPGLARMFGWDIRSVQHQDVRQEQLEPEGAPEPERAEQIADSLWNQYLDKCSSAATVADAANAWNTYQAGIEQHGIIPTLKGYQFKKQPVQQQATKPAPCNHNGTDGTVACPLCGLSASAFISSAADFLSENDGKVITWNQ